MHNKATLRKLSLGVLAAIATLAITIGVADAFTGPGSSGGVGNGAVATDGANNVTVGNSTVLNTTKLSVYASSTSASHYAFQVLQPGGASIFSVRNDGLVNVPGSLTVGGTFTSAVAANNVSSGAFGANTGGGNYSFPGNVGIGTTTPNGALQVVGLINFDPANGSTLLGRSIGANTGSGNTFVGDNAARSAASGNSNTALGYAALYGSGVSDVTAIGKSAFGGFSAGGSYGTAVGSGALSSAYGAYNTAVGYNAGASIGSGTNNVFVGYLAGGSSVGFGSYMTLIGNNTQFNIPGGGAISNSGAIGKDALVTASNSFVIGTSTTNVGIGASAPGYKLEVAGTIYSSSGGYRFPDGTTQTTAATGGSTISAPNVSAGNFGANTGNGNYNFPANLGVGMPSPSYGFDINSTSSPLRVRDTAGRSYLTTATRTGTYGTCPTVDIAGRLTVDCSGPEGGNDTYIRHPVNSIMFFESENVTYPGSFIVRQKGGTYGLWVQQDTNGNVGINTYTPSQKLEVAGTIYSTSGGFKFPDGSTQTTAAGTLAAPNVSAGAFGANTGGGNYSFPAKVSVGTATVSDNFTVASTTGANKVYIDLSSGTNIYLKGGAGPSYETQTGLEFQNSAGDWRGSISANDAAVNGWAGGLDITAGSNRKLGLFAGGGGGSIWLTPTGNAAVGPAWQDVYKLKVSGNLYAENNFLLTASGSTMSRINIQSGSGIADIEMRSNSYSWFFGNRGSNETPNNRLAIYNNTPAEMMTILTGGNVGIGQSNPGYKLEVAGTIYSSSGGFRFPDGTTQTTAAGGATIPAANVSAGTFAGNTGGGNFTFSGLLGIGAAPGTDKLEITTTGTNRSRIRMISGTGVSGIELTTNGASWFLDNRGANEAPNNRLGFYSPTGGEAFTILSAGNVGIGNTNPGSKLSVAGTIGATGTITSSDSSTNIGSHSTYGTGYSAFWRTGADYAVMTNGSDTFINAPAGGGTIYFRMNNAYSPSAMDLSGTTLTIGGGAGKLNVGTVDPIYQIGGEKFATYLPGMIGVKEEVAGELILSCSKGACEKTIDFSKEERGSDLWLFAKATDIKKHLSGASIILTPAFDGRVSYRKGDGTITIMANTFDPQDEVHVSYRFTASRFDADQWGNRTNDKGAGFIINE